jgi:hypothetical protein
MSLITWSHISKENRFNIYKCKKFPAMHPIDPRSYSQALRGWRKQNPKVLTMLLVVSSHCTTLYKKVMGMPSPRELSLVVKFYMTYSSLIPDRISDVITIPRKLFFNPVP